MPDPLRTEIHTSTLEEDQSAVSWAAIAAGGIAAAALTLVLLAFGAGMGFSAISPWSNSGVSSGTFKVGAGIYLIVVAMRSSTIGGYVAGRLRTKWTGLHTNEVAFRDTAHGFLAWGFATVLGAAALGGAATYLAGGVATGTAQGASQGVASSPSAQGTNGYFVDMLLRPDPARQSAASPQAGPQPCSSAHLRQASLPSRAGNCATARGAASSVQEITEVDRRPKGDRYGLYLAVAARYSDSHTDSIGALASLGAYDWRH
jgi:hypothetical protein